MADDSEDTLDDRMESIQRRAENLRELLKEGDEVTVAIQDGDLHVAESYRSTFERKHAKVFGRMLAIEEQMRTGAFPYFVSMVAFTLFIIGLQLTWWENLIGDATCDVLNRWWFYLTAPLAILYLIYLLCTRWSAMVYNRNRDELLAIITAAGLDRDVLLVLLRDEGDLENVIHRLKLDTGH